MGQDECDLHDDFEPVRAEMDDPRWAVMNHYTLSRLLCASIDRYRRNIIIAPDACAEDS
jgi:hypothetical protein